MSHFEQCNHTKFGAVEDVKNVMKTEQKMVSLRRPVRFGSL